MILALVVYPPKIIPFYKLVFYSIMTRKVENEKEIFRRADCKNTAGTQGREDNQRSLQELWNCRKYVLYLAAEIREHAA